MSEYKICKRCVMDTTDPQISFNSKGECNHCADYLSVLKNQSNQQENSNDELESILNKIRKDTTSKYNCLIGVSGGVDSTYLAYLAKEEFGLRPLALHLDNGWNSKLAVKNISKVIRKLKIDLHTHVINWNEFKELQLAYLRASVLDIEVPTDHAIRAAMYHTAKENGIKYILRGYNRHTEGIIPKAWTFYKLDLSNLLDIQRQHGHGTLNTYPMMSTKDMKKIERENGITTIAPLNYLNFEEENVKAIISEKVGWMAYGGKHHESVFTRFYQGYILPRKFGIDKRRAHFSNAICQGLMTRTEAIEQLEEPTYDLETQKLDREYVIKKFELTEEEFEAILNQPPRSHFDYKTELKSKIRKKYIDPRNPLVRFVKRKANFK
ncbi:N-acetyl sugar amidotransferase [Salibacteraceae bacterium]|nr:N-acetyl sugar amidotransferase [Salibacteraceae bacterium]